MIPEISTTEWNRDISPVPMYLVESPGSAAVAEIINLGSPKGRSRMTSVAIKVPVEPPNEITPEIRHILEYEPDKVNKEKINDDLEYLQNIKENIINDLKLPRNPGDLIQNFEDYKIRKEEIIFSNSELKEKVNELESFITSTK